MTRASRARGAERRRSIVEAALTVLGREGGGAVTHRAVAAEAGVPLASTTYYFASKDELVREAFTLAMERDVAALADDPFPGGEDVDVRSAATWLVGRFMPRSPAERASQLVLSELELEAARRPELARLSRVWMAAYVAAVGPVLASLGSTAPARDAWIVVTALEGMTLELMASGRDDPAACRAAVERLLTALTAPGRPAS